MLTWLLENLSTIIISLVLLAIVVCISTYLIKGKKQGKSSCGSGCAHCAMHGTCHNGGFKS